MLPSDSSLTESTFFEQDQLGELQEITSTPIKKILSYTNSSHRFKTIITTENGFCIINNKTLKFRQFEGEQNPFFPEKTGGIILGSILEERTQVAIVPKKSTKSYSNTTVYIFDYRLKTILYENNFFLPIRQLTLTDESIIVSNNKRIIIYNYERDIKKKDHKYYLDLYEQKTPNESLRYLQMFCHEKFGNNSIPDADEQNQEEAIDLMGTTSPVKGKTFCKCGQYKISAIKPYKLLYCQVYSNNGVKRISLGIYDWAIDKEYPFTTVDYNEEFLFTISDDGKYLAYSEEEGRKIKVHKIGNEGVHQTLRISRSIKEAVAYGFFKAAQGFWFTVIRKEGNHNGHMHIFKILQNRSEQLTESKYKRYFGLYERTFKDYGISDNIIGPDFYVHNEVLISYSLCGIVHDVIDFKRSGNLLSKPVQNFTKWSEEEKN